MNDEELRAYLKSRYEAAFEWGPPDNWIAVPKETRGRNNAAWHEIAILHVEQRNKEGISTNQACREFQIVLSQQHNLNVEIGTVMDAVRSSRNLRRKYRGVAVNQFAMAILDNNLDDATKWYRRLSPIQRKRLRLK